MKKKYETPSLEIVKFCYSDQVVASSNCKQQFKQMGNYQTTECVSTRPGYNQNY